MTYRSLAGISCLSLMLTTLASGCGQKTPQIAPPQTPAVPISHPVQRQVTDFADFTGRTAAKDSVDIRARVTGYLTEVGFQEGADVKKGQLLFQIDPPPYKAQLDQAESQVVLNEASLRLARANLARDQAVNSAIPGGVSQQQIDQDQANIDETLARVKAAQASTEVFRLNLEFTRVTSPIDGRVSRYYYTVGNLVIQDQTLLTTVVSLDPMYAYFDVDETTVLRIRRAINEGRMKPHELGKIPVLMALQGETGFPHEGTINFINNQVNPTTGSMTIRGTFANPVPRLANGQPGVRLLSPGMFVRIRLLIGQPYPGLLVVDRAIGSDQGLKYVYVVDADNQVEYRRITTGQLEDDGLRVIASGLKADDWVIVGGIQQVRPHMTVKTQEVPMPTLGQPEQQEEKP